MLDQPLSDKVAIVIGGSRGIGRAIAKGFSMAGAQLAIASRSPQSVAGAVAEFEDLGRPVIGVPTDISKRAEVEDLVEKTINHYGRIDVLVNSAGISPAYARTVNLKEEDWDLILDVNLKGPFLTCQAVGRLMAAQEQGKIINVASIGATTGLHHFVAYCASKGGLIQLTRVLAIEMAEHNVQVNAIAPGYIETDMTSGLEKNQRLSEEILQRTPMRRLGTPDEVVGAALLLASPGANYITGHVLYVDGGWSAA